MARTLLFVVILQAHTVDTKRNALRGASLHVDEKQWGPMSSQVHTKPRSTPAPSDFRCPAKVRCVELYPRRACKLIRSHARDHRGCLKHPCGRLICHRVDCIVSKWARWSACDMKCGRGQQHRERSVLRPALHGGKRCPKRIVQFRQCRGTLCDATLPRQCEVANWGQWGACSATCGPGRASRKRKILREFPGGVCLRARVQLRYCTGAVKCRMNCQLSSWGKWGKCWPYAVSKSSGLPCGPGAQVRRRKVISQPRWVDITGPCGTLEQHKQCQFSTPCGV